MDWTLGLLLKYRTTMIIGLTSLNNNDWLLLQLQDSLVGTEIPYLHLSPPFETCSVDLDVHGNPKCFSAIK